MGEKRKSNGHVPGGDSHSHKKQRRGKKVVEQPAEASTSHPPLPSITSDYESAVFTHQSTVPSHHNNDHAMTYERLEFLGDAYIEIIASRLIWDLYKHITAGRMSQIRELLVKNETLFAFAKTYELDQRIKHSQKMAEFDPKRWLKVVADVFEAYVAAVVLSNPVEGFRRAEQWLTELWMPKLRDVKEEVVNMKAKEELAKKILGRGIKLNYRDENEKVTLSGGMQTYFLGVYLTGWGWEDQHLGSGRGLNKVGAGNQAAMKALENPLIEEIVRVRKATLDQQQLEREEKEGELLQAKD